MRYCFILTIIWILTTLKTRSRASPTAKMFQCLTMIGKILLARSCILQFQTLRCMCCTYTSNYPIYGLFIVARTLPHTSQFITNGENNWIQSNPAVGRLLKRIGRITMESRPFCHEKEKFHRCGQKKAVGDQYGPDIAAILLVDRTWC